MRTAPFLIFIIDVSTRIVKHRKALQSVDFYGILIGRKGAVLQVQRSCFPPSYHIVPRQEEVQFFVILLMVRMLHIRYLKEESIMDILNIVFSALNLLATVVIGVINVTWMISRDVFRDKPRAKHDSKK